MIVTESLSVDIFTILLGLVAVLLWRHARGMKYWIKRGVPCPETSLFTGSLQDFFLGRKSLGNVFADRYFEYKSKGCRYVGNMFSSKPTFTPIDLNIVKSIMQTDFQHFHGRGLYVNGEADILSTNLFNLDGPEWKVMRSKLTPTFTSGKIKMMHTILQTNAALFVEVADGLAKQGPLNIKDLMYRFTIDNISSCAFGLDAKCLQNVDTEFFKLNDEIFPSTLRKFARLIPPKIFPHSWLKAISYNIFSEDVHNFFTKILTYGPLPMKHPVYVTNTIKYREDKKVSRNDFIQMMIEMKNSSNPEKKLTMPEIIAQCFIFYAAGFETSATTMTFACFELARNQEIQDELREEIKRVLKKHNGELTYEAISEMNLLDRVFLETMRMYPPLHTLQRKCMKNYKIPGEDVEIEEGVLIIIAAEAIQYDPEYYPDPEKFHPERFTPENKRNIPQYSYLPFGEGPRICIGARFGSHQTKVGLASLVKNFKITLNEKTKTPLEIVKPALITTVKGGVWVNLEKIPEK